MNVSRSASPCGWQNNDRPTPECHILISRTCAPLRGGLREDRNRRFASFPPAINVSPYVAEVTLQVRLRSGCGGREGVLGYLGSSVSAQGCHEREAEVPASET